MIFDWIVRNSVSRAGIVNVRNALNPMLWLSGVAPVLCWAAAYAFRDDPILLYGLVASGLVPIFGAVAAYFILLVKDPDRLQSEEFIVRQKELLIIERKGDDRPELAAGAREPNYPTVIEAGPVRSETGAKR